MIPFGIRVISERVVWCRPECRLGTEVVCGMKRAEFNPFSKGMLIFDGGMATEIYRNHIFTNRCFDELNLSMPQLIRRIHQSYVNAGAEVLITNTFGANRPGLEKYGLADKVTEINRSGADIARSAAAPIDQNTHESVALVAGSVGPILDEGVGRSLDESAEILAEQVAALREGVPTSSCPNARTRNSAAVAAAACGSVPHAFVAPPESDEELKGLGRLSHEPSPRFPLPSV